MYQFCCAVNDIIDFIFRHLLLDMFLSPLTHTDLCFMLLDLIRYKLFSTFIMLLVWHQWTMSSASIVHISKRPTTWYYTRIFYLKLDPFRFETIFLSLIHDKLIIAWSRCHWGTEMYSELYVRFIKKIIILLYVSLS